MQKIQSYLYPNRIQLLADVAGFNVENTVVYQRNVKIYNGIDNTIEFDIKNADQKRIDLSTISNIELNIMDFSGTALPNSPYVVTPTSLTGIATVTIPQEDLVELNAQYLKYSVSCVKNNKDTLLYADSRFGAVGTIELVGDAMPTFRDDQVFKTFTAEIDLNGNPIYHSPAMRSVFYEAVPSTGMSFDVALKGFTGTVYLEGTTDDTISIDSFKTRGGNITGQTQTVTNLTGTITFTSDIGTYSYFRLSFQKTAGTIDKVTASQV